MTKYWYCIYNPENRYQYNIHYSTSFKTACANLRKQLESIPLTDEYGRIYNEEPPNLLFYHGSTVVDSLMAIMEIRPALPNKTIRMGPGYLERSMRTRSEREYILRKKVPRTSMTYWPEYVVDKDGSIHMKKKR